MGDATLALQVREWFQVCNRLWPLFFRIESPERRRAHGGIQLLCAELTNKTKPLAIAAEARGISSKAAGVTGRLWNFHDLLACPANLG